MNIVVISDAHFYRMPNGEVYTSEVYDRIFFGRFLNVFNSIYVVGRVHDVKNIDASYQRVDDEKINIWPLPDFYGGIGVIMNILSLTKLCVEYIRNGHIIILRAPGIVSIICGLICLLFKRSKVLGMEVIGDPWTLFDKGVVKSKFSSIAKYFETYGLKIIARNFNGVSYVTEKYLQQMYPCKATINAKGIDDYFTANYSSIILPDDSIKEPRVYDNNVFFNIVHVSANYTNYGKGHIPLIRAINYIVDRGVKNIHLTFIGDGPYREKFEDEVKRLGIDKYVSFIGRLPNGLEVKKRISMSDIMVFPTVSEGLPRVLLEAMSEGLPCLSSPVCGIPEILEEKYLFAHDDYVGFAEKIIYLMNNVKELNEMSKKNVEIAGRYTETELQKRRDKFYSRLNSLALKIDEK